MRFAMFNDDNDLVSIDFFIYFKIGEGADKGNNDKDNASIKTTGSVISSILKKYNKMELEDSILDFVYLLPMEPTLKSGSSFSVTLPYNENEIKEKIYETLLSPEQLTKCRAIILESTLSLNTDFITKQLKI